MRGKSGVLDSQRAKIKAWKGAKQPLFDQWLEGVPPGSKEKLVKEMQKSTAEALEALQNGRLQCLRSLHRRLTDWLVRLNAILGSRGPVIKYLDIAIQAWSIDAKWSDVAMAKVKEYQEWKNVPQKIKGFNSASK